MSWSDDYFDPGYYNECPKCGAELLQDDDFIDGQYIETYYCDYCGYEERIIE